MAEFVDDLGILGGASAPTPPPARVLSPRPSVSRETAPGGFVDDLGLFGKPQAGPPVETALPTEIGKPVIQNPDQTVSTEKTITVEADGKHYLIPTIIGGKEVSQDEAVKQWNAGKNTAVGVYDTAEQAETAAQQRSNAIGERLRQKEPGPQTLTETAIDYGKRTYRRMQESAQSIYDIPKNVGEAIVGGERGRLVPALEAVGGVGNLLGGALLAPLGAATEEAATPYVSEENARRIGGLSELAVPIGAAKAAQMGKMVMPAGAFGDVLGQALNVPKRALENQVEGAIKAIPGLAEKYPAFVDRIGNALVERIPKYFRSSRGIPMEAREAAWQRQADISNGIENAVSLGTQLKQDLTRGERMRAEQLLRPSGPGARMPIKGADGKWIDPDFEMRITPGTPPEIASAARGARNAFLDVQQESKTSAGSPPRPSSATASGSASTTRACSARTSSRSASTRRPLFPSASRSAPAATA